jgi:protein involved in polysaccharide export with SLBB domain
MTMFSTSRFKKRRCLCGVAALLTVFSSCLRAQQIMPSASVSSAKPEPLTNSSVPNATGPNDVDFSQRNSLTATQIGRLLQQKPEVVIELKSLVADQLRQQGINTQADAITDEMLFSQIASNADLRANITVWLRARGYVTEASLHASLVDPDEPTDNGDRAPLSGAAIDGLTPMANAEPSQSSSSSIPTTLGTVPGTTSSIERSRASRVASSRSQDISSRQPHNVTDEPEVLHVPAPYNLQSLRDLYTQIPQDAGKLKRFGSEVFLDRAGSSAGAGTDLPVGPDYILGSGDGLTINLWGGVSQNLTRVIDPEGKIVLPEAGSIVVAGLTLQHAQSSIEIALKQQFHNVRVDVAIARLRSVRVYVVGDVQRPGAYEVSSLSTPLNALYAAGGPTSIGSLRFVRHYRGAQLVHEVDLYDFLLHGMRMDEERLQSGDTLLIPPAGPQVAVFGMVKRPAIYELKGGNSTLADVLEDAGDATVAAAFNHITVERIQPNQQRETLSLAIPSPITPQSTLQAISSFHVKDGDRIRVAPILPYSERVIYVEGHVVRPGKYPYHDGMQVSDVLHTYQDLLPEPASKGDIVRLVPPDLHPEAIQFDVADLLIGNSHLALQPFDTVRVLGRYEVDSPQVTIRGEVLRPGVYALSQGMTASQLVKMAGGFKRDALLDSADLTSYSIQDEKKIVSQLAAVNIGTAVSGSSNADVPLKPGDVLTILQISGWNDIGASVTLEGEVAYPGSYGLQEGERLSSVLRRAGGFRDAAYPAGTVLVRTQVRELEEKSRAELIRQIETTSVSARLSPNLTGQDQTATLQAAAQQQNEVLQRLRSQPASGRLVIHVSTDINSWANTPADIEMRSGDVLTVPKRPGFVLVSGQVYNPSAITFVPGKDASWYLRRAGGTNDVANRKEIFVIRANGSVVGRRSGEWYASRVLSTRLDPGDVIVVPQKIIGGSLFWRNLLTVAQITSSIAITAAVAGVL